jgi:hypothetical protein
MDEYAFGGYFQDGGSKGKSKEQLEKELREGKGKVQKTKKLPDGTIEITRADGSKVYAKGESGETINVANPKRQKVTKQTTNAAQYKKDICAKIKAGGYTAKQAAAAGWISAAQIPNFTGCENLKKSETDTSEFYELEEDPKKTTRRCECEKSDGTKYDPGMNEDGTCKDCEETITEDGSADINIRQQQQKDPEWWLQDTVNAGNAFGDLMGIKKQMPYEARVDLEEPRPTFLDPTRQLAANEEQTNAANQAAASFAGPQSLNARLRANNANASTNAANILSNINNQNVGIANQFEANQVGVRNQEQAMNQQMANRVYDKNVVANQQFQNAKSAGRDNVAQAYNTAVTNRYKTDALNQMYPNYQVSPGSGGRVAFTPTDKTASPTKPTKEIVDYIKELQAAGIDEDIIKELVKGQKKKGGSMFQHGGFIYTVFPAVTL